MIITQTPLRISFAGGGTDFPDFFNKHRGRVVSMAVDKYIYCVVKERFDDLIVVGYTKREVVEKVAEIGHELVREAMRKTGVKKGVEITFLSDIPSAGSGLGSSSAVTVGVLNALYQYRGKAVEAVKLAEEACEIEIEILGKPVGVQDQYIAAFGGIRYMEFSGRGVKVSEVAVNGETKDDLEKQLMVFYTGRTRQAEEVLAEQKENISKKTKLLNQMADQAVKAKEFLERGRIEDLGKLLNKGWQLKKQMASRISDREIDDKYRAAVKAGAWGGKICGAGGGGFLMLLVPGNRRDAVRRAVNGWREVPFGPAMDGSKVIFNVRR